MLCQEHGFPKLSLVTSVSPSSLPEGLLDYILCLHGAAVEKFLLVIQHVYICVKGSSTEKQLVYSIAPADWAREGL